MCITGGSGGETHSAKVYGCVWVQLVLCCVGGWVGAAGDVWVCVGGWVCCVCVCVCVCAAGGVWVCVCVQLVVLCCVCTCNHSVHRAGK